MPEQLKPGDRVTVGQGKKVWKIVNFWTTAHGKRLASLMPVEGYSGASVEAARLKRAD